MPVHQDVYVLVATRSKSVSVMSGIAIVSVTDAGLTNFGTRKHMG
jgi:hypothetical protein